MKDLLSINKKIPAINKTQNNKISNKLFSIVIDPPIKAKGIEPIKYGKSKLKFVFLVLIKLIELPDTTIILHTRAITGKIV